MYYILFGSSLVGACFCFNLIMPAVIIKHTFMKKWLEQMRMEGMDQKSEKEKQIVNKSPLPLYFISREREAASTIPIPECCIFTLIYKGFASVYKFIHTFCLKQFDGVCRPLWSVHQLAFQPLPQMFNSVVTVSRVLGNSCLQIIF